MTGGLGNAALLAAIALVPIVVLMMTSFVKTSVVLSLLRNAIGAPDAPSGLVVMGLSLILTFFVMAPVAIDMVHAASAPASSPDHVSPGATGSAGPGGAAGAAAAPGTAATSGAAAGPPARAAGSVARRPASAGSAGPSGAAGAGSAGPSGAAGGGAAGTSGAAGVGSAGTSGAAGAGSSGTSSAATAGSTEPASGAVAATGKPIDLEASVRELLPAQYRPQVNAAARGLGPLRAFLVRHAGTRDRETFVALATRMGRVVTGDELWVLAPAFVTTELREAFAIAVLIFVPFLVIDLIVGLGLAALGLTSMSPQTVALPLKLLLFVSVDGWRLLIDALLRGYV